MEQKEFTENETTKGGSFKMSDEVKNTKKESLEAGNSEKELCETSDNSVNSPLNIVKDRGKIDCDKKSVASSDSSRTQNKQDFKETAKYRDVESYVNQHHHSIGEGLYMTDEIQDLPPRFRTKVIQALENALAIHNVKLDRNPLEYFTSFNDNSKEQGKDEDKLVYIPPNILEDERKSCESKSYSTFSLKTNFNEKRSTDFSHHSNFEPSLNDLEKGNSFSGTNSSSQAPIQNFRNKTGSQSRPHLSRTNSDNNFKKSYRNYSYAEKSSPTTNTYSKNYPTRISVDELFSTDNKATSSSNVTAKNSCSVSSVWDREVPNSELNRTPDSNVTVPHNDSRVNVNMKFHSKKRYADSKTKYEYSGRENTSSNEIKKPFKSQEKYSTLNSTSAYEENRPANSRSTKYPVNLTDSSFDNNSCATDSNRRSKFQNTQFNSDKISDTAKFSKHTDSSFEINSCATDSNESSKFKNKQYHSDTSKFSKYSKSSSELPNTYQNVSMSPAYSKKDNFSMSKGTSLKNFANDHGKNDDNRYLRTDNSRKYPNKGKLCDSSEILDVPPAKKESNTQQPLGNTSVQNKNRKQCDSHSSISSCYSSKSYDNAPGHKLRMMSQGSSINAVNNVNNFHNSFESSSRGKPMHQQFNRGNDFSKKSNNYRYHRDTLNDSPSVFSDKSVKSHNSSESNSSVCEFNRGNDFSKKSNNYRYRRDKFNDSSSVFSVKSARSHNSSENNLPVCDNFNKNEKGISDRTPKQTKSKGFVKSSGKDFDETREKKFFPNPKLPLRDKKFSEGKVGLLPAENIHYSNKTSTARKPNYNKNYHELISRECEQKKEHNFGSCIERGFFIKVEVSEKVTDLEYWVKYFQSAFPFPFELERCCHFSDTLILELERKEHAYRAFDVLYKERKILQKSKKPHFLLISALLTRLTKPCNCKEKVIRDCLDSIKKHFDSALCMVNSKKEEIVNSMPSFNKHNTRNKANFAENKIVESFESSISNYTDFMEKTLSDIEMAENLRAIQHLRHSFIQECNTFKRCLPIYTKKTEILNMARYHSVSVIVAETGSGKSTQLVEYLLHSFTSKYGRIICTQPRKLAAITIAQFVSGQLGSAIGKIVGYDVGIEKKCSDETKIIYMTDYCLLKYFLKNRDLKGVSCIIIDEAHERSLYTDLILGLLKKCLDLRRDLSVLITSATINPAIFVDYFGMPEECVIEVPGRTYPVNVVWYQSDVEIGWDYLDACVQMAYEIHMSKKEGDILVFLTAPGEAEEAIYLLKKRLSKNDNTQLLSLHGKIDIKEQMLIFQKTLKSSRKIIFATNVAETAVTIPGIRYVVDSGMSKELMFDPQKNKSYLAVTFTTKSSAEQRKGRAGRTQSGVCYRMYSKRNYDENMTDNAIPEIFKSNLQKALLKIFEFGIDPEKFDFIEAPPAKTISNSVESLEHLGAIENKKLTDFGRKLVKLPLEPQLSKLVLQGIKAKIAIEAIIIAALVSESGKIFIRSEDNRTIADDKKRKFCHVGGDLCTYLEIYKRFKEIDIPERYAWCVDNFLSFKSLSAARKTIKEILITLRTELGIHVSSRYNNSDFKNLYEKIIFDSFSENLCVLSGHPKLGYLSPYLSESFFIHPSSTLSYLGKDSPEFLIYSTLMETSRNFLFDITPISEATLKSAYQTGKLRLPLHTLRCLQIPPKVMGPFGESVLIRHILGKAGAKIKDLEKALMHLTSMKNLYVDVDVIKGLITVYISRKLSEKVENHIYKIINEAHVEMLKEEDVVKISGTSLFFALSAGGIITDVIMPGEFRELIFNCARSEDSNELENILQIYGPLQSLSHVTIKQKMQVCATFKKVCDAKRAYFDLKERKKYNVSPKLYLPGVLNKMSSLHMLSISWCCRPSIGFGSVELFSEDDLIEASGTLTCNSFFVENNLIMFEVAQEGRKLRMKNLPECVEECTIAEKLKESLPHIQIKSIVIHRKSVSITEASVEEAKKKLLKLLNLYVPSSKFLIDMKCPEKEASWNATVYFDNAEDSENVFMKLKDNTCIESYPLSVCQIFKSKLYCKKNVFDKFSVQISNILEKKINEGICDKFLMLYDDKLEMCGIEFNCPSLKQLYETRKGLQYFVEGDCLEFIGHSKYHFLFSAGFAKQIRKLQTLTSTLINLDIMKKAISIYGFPADCEKVKQEIYRLANDPDYYFTRTFNLKDSCIPNGFLKNLYSKYGYDLHDLVANFKLTFASVDKHGSTLTLKGLKKHIREAEQALEKMCEELIKSRGARQKKNSDEELCPICLDPVSYDFQRLEHCGHAFCRQCLLLQLESRILPLVCVKEDCEKLIFLEDIKRIISFGGDHLRKDFCAVALQHHVSCNIGKLSYCRTPDCQLIYRVTEEGSEYICSGCRNSICNRCQSPYHYGMSCEMFQQCQKDVDYSLKMWVKEKESSRKHCPSCKTVIEKVDGCNHMKCLYCKAHMCWLCLEIFKTGDEVYSHMPYCPQNQ